MAFRETCSTRSGRRCVGLWTILLALAAGCSSSGDDKPDDGSANAGPLTYKPCDQSKRAGLMRVQRLAGLTSVFVSVKDGVNPKDVLEVTASAGGCSLLEGRKLLCQSACGADQTCGEAGACVKVPTALDLGTVTIDGLNANVSLPFEPKSAMDSVAGYKSGRLGVLDLAPAASLSLRTSGGVVPAFSLRGAGSAPLEVPQDKVAMEKGKPVVLTWTAAPAVESTRVHIEVDVAKHAFISAVIDCDGVADTGQFEIPASLVSKLLDIGLGGFPMVTMSRRTVDSRDLSVGCVEFATESTTERELAIPGLISCADDDENECPAEKPKCMFQMCR